MKKDVKKLGQVFTTEDIVTQAISLIKNGISIFEPSAGDGSFYNRLKHKNITGIEIDSRFCPDGVMNMDFFDYSIDNKFDTIIGNPPYVKYSLVYDDTKEKLKDFNDNFDLRTNLYLFFIYKSFLHLEDGGEIIFITPPDFLKSTSALKLNKILFDNGSITDYYEYSDKKIFDNASPNVAVWRYEKNNMSRKSIYNNTEKKFQYMNGQLVFSNQKLEEDLKTYFDVKVGGVSGLDELFVSEDGNEEFVCSYTRTNNQLKRMYYNIENDFMKSKKDILINRKIKKFTDKNYYVWGRDFHHSNKKRIYVNCKTRQENPFFINDCLNYDGSVLALIVKDDNIDIEKFKDILNGIDWDDLGFMQGGRYIFTQKTLENLKIPKIYTNQC